MDELLLLDADGKKIAGKIIAMFDGKGKKYVAYTDGMGDGDKMDTLVSRFVFKDGDTLQLENIDDDEEWKFVEDFLKTEVFSEDD